MNIWEKIKRWFSAMYDKLRGKAVEDFGITPINSALMDDIISRCARAYAGVPDWIDPDDNIKTINFAKTICSEVARLTTLAIKITVDGSLRADWIQEVVDKIFFQLRHWVEYGAAYGTIILKPTGDNVILVTPDNFEPTDCVNEKITGGIFSDRSVVHGKYYTRLEYHRFEGEKYVITNICYVSDSEKIIGNKVNIENTPWSDLEPETSIDDLERPLFSVFRMSQANNVEINSPMGLPAFHEALEELRDLDVAYSRNTEEIFDSSRTVLLDSDRLMPTGNPVSKSADGFSQIRDDMGLPRYVKNVFGDGVNTFYQEINPTLNTDTRLTGINNLLSQIGFKCGFSNGYFVFNEKTGMVTATQVESDDRRTIQTIKDVRDKLESCLDDLIYCLDAYADLYDLAPDGEYEVTYDFGDLTYDREEDRVRWWQYVQSNKVPAWMFFVKFEGMSEEEAKAMTAEAQSSAPGLFEEYIAE